MDILKKINYIFNRKQKMKLLLLTGVIVIGALWELLGITGILPFVNVAMDPNSVYENELLFYFYNLFNMKSTNVFLALLAGALIGIYVIKNVYLALMNYAIYRFTYNNQRQLAVRMLKTYMKQPYTFFLKNNSAELSNNVYSDTSMLFDTVLSVMQMLVECLVCMLLLVFLLLMDKSITLAVGTIMVFALFVIVKGLKKDLHKRGEYVRECRSNMSKWLLQSFGGIKQTKIMERDEFFVRKYDDEYAKFAHNHCIYQTFAYLPKPLMETLCIASVLIVVAWKLIRGVDSTYFISTISVFAVAAFRILPAFNRITGFISRIMFNYSGVNAVYHDLKEIEELEKEKNNSRKNNKMELAFNNEISIENVSFHYPGIEEDVLANVNFTIPKNYSVAFVGPSGAGKTTMADIVLGILFPQNGKIKVDGQDISDNMSAWHSKLGYIPQDIYLIDDTIRNNIAFAVDEEDIDDERVLRAIEEAQLKEFIGTLEHGLDTMIGEKGVRLSGGQRQRIGIARALYSNPEILVLDEATSALDTETETAVMEAIESLAGKMTLIIIAHRLTTIRNCDIVYEIKDEKVTQKEKETL